MKGMNGDLATKIRAHLDELAGFLDREERADEAAAVPETDTMTTPEQI